DILAFGARKAIICNRWRRGKGILDGEWTELNPTQRVRRSSLRAWTRARHENGPAVRARTRVEPRSSWNEATLTSGGAFSGQRANSESVSRTNLGAGPSWYSRLLGWGNCRNGCSVANARSAGQGCTV